MRFPQTVAFSVLATMAFLSCDGSGSGTPVRQEDSGNGSWDTTITTSILGRTADGWIVQNPQSIHGWCGVEDSAGKLVPWLDVDTILARIDTVRFRIDAGDLLYIASGSTDAGVSGLVRLWSQWARESGPSGSEEGIWNLTFLDTADVVHGDVADSSLARIIARERSLSNRFKAAGRASQLEVSASKIVSRARWGEFAANELLYWDLFEKDLYEVQAERVDANTLRYVGRGETVTVKFLDRRTQELSSSDSSRRPYKRIANPLRNSDCPEDPWFDDFLRDHSRAIQGI